MHAEVHAGLACLRLGLAAAVWLAGPGSVAARTPADVQSVVTVATAAVREAFGGEADVILSQPVLSLTTEAVIGIAEVQAALRRWADDKLTKWTAGAVGPRTIMMGWSPGTSVALSIRRGWGPDGRCTGWDPRTRVDDWPPPGAGESSCWSKS